MNRTYAIWSSGVDRWHQNRSIALRRSCDTTDGHTARCLHLLFALWPDNDTPPMALVRTILDHDVPEAWTGDTPAPAKGFPGLRGALKSAEQIVCTELCLAHPNDLTSTYESWVKLVDKLDAYLWAWRVDPVEARRYGWKELRTTILKHADDADAVPPQSRQRERVAALMEYAENSGTRPESLDAPQ